MTAFRVGLVLVLAIAAAAVANFVLLGVATGSSEPVGKLSPRAELVVPASPPAPPATTPVTTPTKPVEPGDSGKHSDD
jgi:hypothetical protein